MDTPVRLGRHEANNLRACRRRASPGSNGGEKLIAKLLISYIIGIIIFGTQPMYRFVSEPTPRRLYRDRDPRAPDLPSQYEALLDAVWAAEANWRFDDRLDQALSTRRAA